MADFIFPDTIESAPAAESEGFVFPDEITNPAAAEANSVGSKLSSIFQALKQAGAGAVDSSAQLSGFLQDQFTFVPNRGNLGTQAAASLKEYLGGAPAKETLAKVAPGEAERLREVAAEALPAEDPDYRYARRFGEFLGPTVATGGAAGGSSAALKAALSALTGSAAGQYVEDQGGNQWAQLGASIFGGAAPEAARSILAAGRNAITGPTTAEVLGSAAKVQKDLTGLTAEQIKAAAEKAAKDKLGLAQLRTTAEITDNAGMGQLEKTLASRPEFANQYAAAQSARADLRDQIINKMSKGKSTTEAALGEELVGAAKSKFNRLGDAEKAAFEALPEATGSLESTQAGILEDLATLTKGRKYENAVGAETRKLIKDILKPIPTANTTEGIQRLRSDASQLLRDFNSAKTPADKIILRNIQENLLKANDEAFAALAEHVVPAKGDNFIRIIAPNAVDDRRLSKVIAEMEKLGSPTIKVIDGGDYYLALEGSHRLAAAQRLNKMPELDVLNLDDSFVGHDIEGVKSTLVQDLAEFLSPGPESSVYDFNTNLGKIPKVNAVEKYATARGLTKLKKSIFENSDYKTTGEKLLDPGLDPAKALTTFTGTKRSAQELIKATDLNSNPTLRAKVNKSLLEGMRGNGDKPLTPARVEKFLDKNEEGLNILLGKKQVGNIKAIATDLQSQYGLQAKSFGASTGGSVTAQKTTVAGAIADAIGGSTIPNSGVISKSVNTIRKTLGIDAEAKVSEYLFQAAMNPKFAEQLAMTPTTTRVMNWLERLKEGIMGVGKAGAIAGGLETLRPVDAPKETPKAPAAVVAPAVAPTAKPKADAAIEPTSAVDTGFKAALKAIEYVESRGNKNAVSPKGAIGTHQVMPIAMRDVMRAKGINDKIYSDAQLRQLAAEDGASEYYGTEYVKLLYDRFDGNWPLVFAAYNGGPSLVKKLLKDSGGSSFEDIARRLPTETRNYVPAVQAALSRITKA